MTQKEKANRKNLGRRSFVKALVTGLFAFGASTRVLLNPSMAHAANCQVQVCYARGSPYYSCQNYVLLWCQSYTCYAIDQLNFPCSQHVECSAIGCC